MWIPGFGSEDLRPYKKAVVTDAHKQVRKGFLWHKKMGLNSYLSKHFMFGE